MKLGQKVYTIWAVEWFDPEAHAWRACKDGLCFDTEASARVSLELLAGPLRALGFSGKYRVARYARMENF